MPDFHGATLTVDLSALLDNYRLLKSRHAKNHIAAVVKANAYGLGAQTISRSLWQEGCRDFFVATLEEGIELRQYLTQAQIGVFGGLGKREEEAFLRYELTPVLNTLEQIERWQKAAPLSSAIIHVDTGMTRLGLSESDVKKLSTLAPRPSPLLLMSHLACANDPAHPKNAEQLERFNAAMHYFPGVKTSFANSSGLFLPEDFHGDMGRPGCALYGITPAACKNPMRQVATLCAPILQIRTLDRDETVGYGALRPAKKGDRIAITSIGYADGLPRGLTGKGFAYVAGERVPFAGRVSMDMIALDVSNVPEQKLTDDVRVEFINEKQTVNDIACLLDTIGYEIFTRIGSRVKRLYING